MTVISRPIESGCTDYADPRECDVVVAAQPRSNAGTHRRFDRRQRPHRGTILGQDVDRTVRRHPVSARIRGRQPSGELVVEVGG